jgi:hypothetical protein
MRLPRVDRAASVRSGWKTEGLYAKVRRTCLALRAKR